MKTLSSPGILVDLRSRIALVAPTDTSRWGSMNAHQMLCHLSDAFSCPLGDRTVATFRAMPFPPLLFKWIALRIPVKWPPGVPTPPEIDQRLYGTSPADFGVDRAVLVERLDHFARAKGPWIPHPMFGTMTQQDWMRWGYLHTDHHLRQFGR